MGYMASVYQLMADVYMKNNESDSVDFYIDKALTIERELAIKKPETKTKKTTVKPKVINELKTSKTSTKSNVVKIIFITLLLVILTIIGLFIYKFS